MFFFKYFAQLVLFGWTFATFSLFDRFVVVFGAVNFVCYFRKGLLDMLPGQFKVCFLLIFSKRWGISEFIVSNFIFTCPWANGIALKT